MNRILSLVTLIVVLLIPGCSSSRKAAAPPVTKANDIRSKVVIKKKVPRVNIQTKNYPANDLVAFAETLVGIPYKYGSSVKEKGFDCSGFISYVFNHFKIAVPRISADFTNAGKEVLLKDSRRGDLILFTGSDAKSGQVGHMGIITKNKSGLIEFIHASTSRGVMVSGMNSYFVPRFVKVNRVFRIF